MAVRVCPICDIAECKKHAPKKAQPMTDLTIPPEAVEAGTRKIAKMRGCDKAVFSKCVSAIEAGIPCKCEEEASAAIRAALKAWPGMTAKQCDEHVALFNSDPAIILPLFQKEVSNG